VIWVPTQEELVTAMLQAAQVTPKDYVIDLGSGDGRIPIAAAKNFGARAVGIEYNPQMVQLAQCYVRAEGLTDKVQIKEADIFETDFSAATVLTLYLLPNLNLRLQPTILKMKPGTRVVSNSFELGDWTPDQTIEPKNGYTRAYLWIVPAQVEGAWTFREQGGEHEFQMQLEQSYQQLDASIPSGSQQSVRDAKLRGAEIQFMLLDANGNTLPFKGTVNRDAMQVSTKRKGKTVTYLGQRAS
jgi:hypothetical protein